MLQLEPHTTALVLIDLQNGIIGMNLVPRSGAEVVETASTLAQQFRAAGALVVLVNVAFAADLADAPSSLVDQPMRVPPGGLPADFADLAAGLAQPSDLRITKHHWGAFHGTELDLQLRRRGIRTIVLGGITTNIGVESTAREAWQHGYDVVLVADATTAGSAAQHEMAITHILPRLARVRPAAAIQLAAR